MDLTTGPSRHALIVMVLATMVVSAADDSSTLASVVVSARRNATAHWLVSVEAESGIQRIATGAGAGAKAEAAMEVRAELGMARRGAHNTVRLSSTFVVRGSLPPPDYEPSWGGSAYKLFTSGLPWPAAQKRCQQDGAHLIVLESQPEAQVVKDFFARNLTLQNTDSATFYHAGVYKRGNDFIDVLGEPVPDWARRALEANGTSNCGRVIGNGSYEKGDCEMARAFICEHE